MTRSKELFATDRLIVRSLDGGDVEALFAVYGDAEAMRWVDDGLPIPYDDCARWVEVTARNYATRGYGMSVVLLAESLEPIGFCGIVHPGGQEEPEVKYAFLREHWGQGFASEAVRGMLAYVEEHFGITRVIATLSPENLASRRVLEKVGMLELELRSCDEGDEGDEGDEASETLVMVRQAPA